MEYDPDLAPQLRYVEAQPVKLDDGLGFVIYDPTGLAANSITVSEPVLFLLSKFDGTHTLSQAGEAFLERFGQAVEGKALAEIVKGLAGARLLAGDDFDRFFQARVDEYRSAPARVMRGADELQLDEGAGATIQTMLDSCPSEATMDGKVVGLVAPHLDYPRGTPCYSAAYSVLVNRAPPDRVVVLGTNHFGRSSSAVVTGKDFATPLGTTPTDRDFIERLENRCGDLRSDEFDHDREHSVELQLMICQHLWGAESFRLVPVLCPDPCGPTGTAPYDGRGVDLRDFAVALRDSLRDDPDETVVIAGADLSHVGAQFGDAQELNEQFLARVKQVDQQALDRLAGNEPDAFLKQVGQENNPTRVCSAGCLFTTMCALPEAGVTVLRYHQAVDAAGHVGVTCAAAVFTI